MIERDEPLWYLTLIFAAAISISLLCERLAPYESSWNQARRDGLRDILHGLVNESSSALGVMVIPLLAGYMPNTGIWPENWPLALAVGIQLLLQHSNVDIRLGPAARLWAVATGHRFHHLASDKRGNVNFGLFTLVWDHLLGTYVSQASGPKDGDVGIEHQPNYPMNYWAQMIQPFKPLLNSV